MTYQVKPNNETCWIKTNQSRICLMNGVAHKEVMSCNIKDSDTKGVFADSNGNIRTISNDLRFLNNKQIKQRSTYQVFTFIDSFNNKITKTVHSLVAEAWIGPRPKGYQINHKDGDKHNNAPYNLEYVTASENMKHAYETGLTKQTSPVRAFNPYTNDVKYFYSLSEFARTLGVSNPKAVSLLTSNDGRIWSDGYIYYYTINDINEHTDTETVVKDYRSNKIYTTKSLTEACLLTGTYYSLACTRINKGELINGCLFYTLDKVPSKWPYIYKEDIEASVVLHNKIKYGVVCKDYTTGLEYSAINTTKLSKILEGVRYVSRQAIDKALDSDKLRLCKGYVFKYCSDDREWPIIDITNKSIETSQGTSKRCYVKNYRTGEVKSFKSLNEAVKTVSEEIGKKLYTKTVSDKIGELICGYVFNYIDDWSDCSEEEVNKSIVSFHNNVRKSSRRCYCKDYATGKVYSFDSVRNMYRYIDKIRHVNISSIEKRLRSGNLKPLNDFAFSYNEDVEWLTI